MIHISCIWCKVFAVWIFIFNVFMTINAPVIIDNIEKLGASTAKYKLYIVVNLLGETLNTVYYTIGCRSNISLTELILFGYRFPVLGRCWYVLITGACEGFSCRSLETAVPWVLKSRDLELMNTRWPCKHSWLGQFCCIGRVENLGCVLLSAWCAWTPSPRPGHTALHGRVDLPTLIMVEICLVGEGTRTKVDWEPHMEYNHRWDLVSISFFDITGIKSILYIVAIARHKRK